MHDERLARSAARWAQGQCFGLERENNVDLSKRYFPRILLKKQNRDRANGSEQEL